MPTYDYQCRRCGHTVEVIHSMLEEGPSTCERCGGELRRVFYPTGIIFKGSGFYKTDSRSSGSGSGTATASAETKSKDAKPAAASDSSGDSSSGPPPPSSDGTKGTTKREPTGA